MDADQRLTEIEVKVTYQDRLIDELNQVVIELRQELDAMSRRVKLLEQQVVQGPPEDPANEPPPHY